jgi:hypothetical protein
MTRPVLRSGLRVTRRDDDHLQIGLDAPDRLVLRDRPGLRAALSELDRPPAPELRALLERLIAEGWVVDAAETGRAVRRRARRRPAVTLVADPSVRDAVARAGATAGLRLAELGGAPHVDRTDGLTVVATVGEPRRETSDRLVRADEVHLWLAVLPRAVRIGPFVEPGRTPCLRCVDAHLGEIDPRRATVLHQLEELPLAPYAGWDPTLLDLGAAWAVREVVRALDGDVGSLRSATMTVGADLAVVRQEWLRHPHCGCAWG